MQTYKGQCHCGTVQFEATTDLTPVGRCNCSFCQRRGAIMHKLEPANFKITAGEEQLTLYEFHTNTAKHYFCPTCGVYTFHRPRTTPELWAINVGCLEGVDFDALDIAALDGQSLP